LFVLFVFIGSSFHLGFTVDKKKQEKEEEEKGGKE